MRLFTLFALLLSSCQSTIPTAAPALEPNNRARSTAHDCRLTEIEPAGQGVDLILGGIARAQTNDLRCGPPSDTVRICRALLVIATLDPAQHLGDPLQFQRTSDAVQWVLSDALVVSPPALSLAIETILDANRTLNATDLDDKRIEALVSRADPAVTIALDEHWETQCL